VTNKPYRSLNAFRVGLERSVKNEAAARGVPTDRLRRQFVLQRFLARVFNEPAGRWVLKGGTGLIVRNPSARFSKDIDLYYPADEQEITVAVDGLRRLADRPLVGDLLSFTIGDPQRGGGQDIDHVVAKLKVTAYIGAAEYGGHFPIDLSLNQRAAEPIDWLQPRPVIELPGTDPLPRFALYPLAEQVADKICAMFATYRGAPSSRYRDLVDLVFIITGQELDASRTINALRGEAGRRQLDLPAELVSPGAGWDQGYRTAAAETSLSAELHTLDAALKLVGTCLAPLLSGLRTVGTWNPNSLHWLD